MLAACGSSSSSKSGSGDSTTSTTNGGAGAHDGGTLIVGAEQEPDCVDWLGSCAGSRWGTWMAQYQTMPRAFDVREGRTARWTERARAPVLTGMPTFATVTGKQTITYKINPTAVWSDGVADHVRRLPVHRRPDQQTGKDIYDRPATPTSTSVDVPDPKTAVVTFKTGKTYARVARRSSAAATASCPSHILKGKDRDDADEGRLHVVRWPVDREVDTRAIDVTLTPNPKYWGTKPHLDKVDLQVRSPTPPPSSRRSSRARSTRSTRSRSSTSVDAIKAGSAGRATRMYNADTGTVEALWINNAKFPFDSKAVRQAFGYSIDRDAIVKKLFGALGVDKAVSSRSTRRSGPSTTRPRRRSPKYTLDLDKVNSLMTGDGWTKGSDGIWAKGGKTAVVHDQARRPATSAVS